VSKALNVKNLTRRFGTQTAVDGVSLHVDVGEFMVLLGPSGCGKTTLLRCIAGLDTPSAGEIELDLQCVYSNIKTVDLAPQARGVGFVFQDLGLWPHLTVMGHLLFVLKDLYDQETCLQMAEDQLASLRIDHLAKKKPAQLSGGEAQRLALARALVTKPEILLLDEPLASLDTAVSAEIRVLLRDIKESSGTTMVYVTHSRVEALELGDRIAVMRDGAIVQVSTPQELYEKPLSEFAARFLGSCNVLDGQVDSSDGVFSSVLGAFDLNEETKAMQSPRLVLRDHQVVAAESGITGSVTRSQFCGSDYLWQVEVGGQSIQMRGDSHQEVGADVRIFVEGEPWFVEGAKP
jgi:ABC-type sugar transport system ATPase subunit